MRSWPPRAMTFQIRPAGDGASEARWRWFVYDRGGEDFLRNGQTIGRREDAERAAQAAIAVMGGVVVEPPR
ncbi:hypothetical protein [Lichenibacterium dinghuense]|uniref:hypothetical protein n=1 Tax=Lichenibacterium dinghuense TaxID=2895977 RepID=UPI001F17930B|nr:hypothetical protein [Lichenibacterium sp. 6Y81]